MYIQSEHSQTMDSKDSHSVDSDTKAHKRKTKNIADTADKKICRRRARPVNANAARERSRVKTLRTAFLELQQTLPSVPPDTKLSKLDVLVLATTYISHLMSLLNTAGVQGTPSTAACQGAVTTDTHCPQQQGDGSNDTWQAKGRVKDYLHPVKVSFNSVNLPH